MSEQPPVPQNAEALSFPLRLLIQVVSLAIVLAVYTVRNESKLNNVEQSIEQIRAAIEKKSDKGDAIHTALGADVSNLNTRTSVLESQVAELRAIPHHR